MKLDDAWLLRLAGALDAAPAAPRAALALTIGAADGALIGSIESTLALQLAGAGLPLRDTDAGWQIEVPDAAAVDPTLAAIAGWLHANGIGSGRRDELLAVVDAQQRRVGAIARAAVRPLGIATHAVHLVGCDAHGAVWVQQRALDKAVDPGRWDTTMGGLIADRESVAQTLERETWEEAGWRIDALQPLDGFGRFTVRRPVAHGYMVEHIEMFEACVPPGAVPQNQDGEVERFECLPLSTLIQRLQADAFTLEAAAILVRWLEHRSGR